MKRILIIIGAIILLIGIAVALYFLFFRSTPGTVVGNPGTNFPDGDSATIDTKDDNFEQPTSGTEVAPNFVKITDGPVALGTVAFATSTRLEPGNASSTETVHFTEVRYIERASGNVYAYNSLERSIARISNRTIPGVQEAAWLPSGSLAFVRFLEPGSDEIETYALPADGSEGYALERGLDQVLVTGSSTVVTLLSSTNGSIVTGAHADGSNAKTLFSLLLSSVRLSLADAGFLVVTKASSQSDGYALRVRGGVSERLLGPLKGLTVLPSPSGKFILYSYLSGNSVKSALYDVTAHSATVLPVIALPEKCAWARDEVSLYCGVPRSISGEWPDAWYQGTVSFTDRIWRIDLDSRVASLIVDPKIVANEEIDAVALTLDPESDVLVFTNRNNGSLWLYDL